MTLQRQLFLTICILFTLLFLGTFGITLVINHTYLNNQLRTHAHDAATSLGLILSQEANQKDLATMTSMIDAVFDRGYYQDITLVDMNNKPLVVRDSKLVVADVPNWFIDFIHFKMPTEDSLVMAGWQQFGKISVSSHPGYAYQQLWATTYITFIYYILVSAIILLLGIFSIHSLLKPLRAIIKQAISIGNGDFVLNQQIPKTQQLRQLAETINSMTKKLAHRFEEAKLVTQELRKRVYQDPITGLYNQSFFLNHLQHEVTELPDMVTSSILQIEITGFTTYNEKRGMQQGDELLRIIAKKLEHIIANTKGAILARFMGARFAIFIFDYQESSALDFLQSIIAEIGPYLDSLSNDGIQLDLAIGCEIANSGMPIHEIVAALDLAMTLAKTKPDDHFDIQTLGSGEIQSDIVWLDVLDAVLSKQSFRFLLQPCLNSQNNLIYHQVIMNGLDASGNEHSAKILTAMAVRFDKSIEFDQLLITQAKKLLNQAHGQMNYLVISISMSALRSSAFHQWFENEFRDFAYCKQCVFELSEFNMLDAANAVVEFSQRITGLGAKLAFSQFGKSGTDLGYLKLLKIVYLKIDPSFTHNIHELPDNQLFVEVLISVAHCLDIMVIADEVDPQEANFLKTIELDGLQGDGLIPPVVVST